VRSLVARVFVISAPSSSDTFVFTPERIDRLLLKIFFPFPVPADECPKQADTQDKTRHSDEYECDLTAPEQHGMRRPT
jgi:hypothetical protein